MPVAPVQAWSVIRLDADKLNPRLVFATAEEAQASADHAPRPSRVVPVIITPAEHVASN